eukprot:14394192-Heterocapsa_arctica.AAC.1
MAQSDPVYEDSETNSGVASSAGGDLFQRAGSKDASALPSLRGLGVKEQWLIGAHELKEFKDQVLGTGGFGTVIAGEFCSSLVAIKKVKEGSSAAQKCTVLNELRIMRRICHPNIVIFYGACLDGGRLSLGLERVKGAKLSGFIYRLEVWRPDSPLHGRQVSIVKGVCQALIYLHSRQPCVGHLDLKPENIMVEQRDTQPFPKLLDFGLARRVTRNATHLGGTVRYMAPEILLQRRSYKPHPAADVDSLGQLLIIVSSGRRPTNRSEAEVVKIMRSGKQPPGTANATAGGWGNLGGGHTQIHAAHLQGVP